MSQGKLYKQYPKQQAILSLSTAITLERVYSRPSGFHAFPASEIWILESFPHFAAKSDQLICASLVAN
jgi:hypothetical protein